MNKNKLVEKLKEGVSVKELEGFARKYTTEVFSVLSIIIATISSIFGFFTGPAWTIIFVALGAIVAVLFPVSAERGLKQLYSFTFKQEKSTQLILGVVKLVVAIFVPFVLFALVGLLAGSAYHYFMRHGQIVQDNKPPKGRRGDAGEHD